MKRKLLLIFFILIFGAWRPFGIETKPQPLLPENDPRSARDFIYVSGTAFYLHGEPFAFKGVNYYPSKNCWRKMWSDWDPAAINAELALLDSLGVNVVRVFLDYDLFEKHRGEGANSLMLTRLDELLGVCDAHGMRALVTPFVWGRSKISTDRQHVRHIVSRFAADPRVFGWDISNELDHGWIENPANRKEIQEWAAAIFAEVKACDPNHMVTAGDYGWYLGDRSDEYGRTLSLDSSLASVPFETQDFICFHWYSHYYALEAALKLLKGYIRKPILIEEIGFPTAGVQEDGTAWLLSEEQVSLYYIAWLTAAAEAGAYIMPWCGFDYSPETSPYGKNSIQNYFGLYAADYRLKAAGTVFRDFSLEGRYLMKMLAGLPAIKFERRNYVGIKLDR